MKNIVLKISVSITLALVLIGCKKKSEDPQPVVVEQGAYTQHLVLHFHNMVNEKPVDFASVFTTSAGHRFTFHSLRYYISNIRLVKSDGREEALANTYLLVSPSVDRYDLGEVPGGTYKGIKFAVGIDSATNHKDPTVYPATHPLAIQSPAIHWSWNSGYIFTMLEGTCDTTVNNTDTLTYGQFSHGLFYHIGLDPLYRQVDLSNSSFTVSRDGAHTLKIKADFNTFLAGVNLKTENASHSFGSLPLATRIANNIPTMFSILP